MVVLKIDLRSRFTIGGSLNTQTKKVTIDFESLSGLGGYGLTGLRRRRDHTSLLFVSDKKTMSLLIKE